MTTDADLGILTANDLALVAHLRRDYDKADEATRARLRQINDRGLAESRRSKREALRLLASAERAIALREAWLPPTDDSRP